MSKSRKQRSIERKDKRSARNFFRVVLISTLVLLVLLYLIYQNS